MGALDVKDYDPEKEREMEIRRQERRRQEEEARQARIREINHFYESLRNSNPFGDDSSQVTTKKAPAVLKMTVAPGNEKCKDYFNASRSAAAKQAIAGCDIKALQRIVGPDLWIKQRMIKQKAQENLWRWLYAKCELVVLQAKGRILQAYADKIHFPTTRLSKAQRTSLREKYEEAFSKKNINIMINAVNDWGLTDSSLAYIMRERVRAFLEEAATVVMTENFTHLAEKFYDLNTECRRLKNICADCDAKKDRFEEEHKKLKNSFDHVLQAFETEMIQGVSPEEQSSIRNNIQELRKSKFAECDLSQIYNDDGQHRQSLLLDDALKLYTQASITYNDEKKRRLLPIIELLLKHGDIPSEDMFKVQLRNTDWSLLRLILRYLDLQTEFSLRLRQQLLAYVCQRDETNSWTTRWLQWLTTRPAITAQRQDDIRLFMSLLCSGQTGAVLDNALASAIEEGASNAQRLVRYPGLYQMLGVVLENKTRGMYIAIPATLKELPMVAAMTGHQESRTLEADISDAEILINERMVDGDITIESDDELDVSNEHRFAR